MRRNWILYPLSAIADAISTTLGGVLTFVLATNAGTYLSIYVFSDELLDLWAFFLCGFSLIAVSCIQIWGLFYLGWLIWYLHRLLFCDSSRFLAAISIILAQFIASILTMAVLDPYEIITLDADVIFRFVVVILLILTIQIAAIFWSRRCE